MKLRQRAVVVSLLSFVCTVHAQSEFDGGGEQLVEMKWLAESLTAEEGQTFVATLTFAIVDGWHIGWRYPGMIGLPTQLKLSLPAGVEVLQQRWSLPKYAGSEGMDALWVYEGQAGVQLKLRANEDFTGEGLLKAELSYLVCADACLQGTSFAEVAVRAGRDTVESAKSKPGDLLFERPLSEVRNQVTVKDTARTRELHFRSVADAKVEVFFEPEALADFKVVDKPDGLRVQLIKGETFTEEADVLVVVRPVVGESVGVLLGR